MNYAWLDERVVRDRYGELTRESIAFINTAIDEKIARDRHITSQDMPSIGQVDVTPLVVKDLLERSAVGIKKYGRPLQSNNGRSALVDLYQELLDACQYIKQEIIERELKGENNDFD
jgi:hypothetical protein